MGRSVGLIECAWCRCGERRGGGGDACRRGSCRRGRCWDKCRGRCGDRTTLTHRRGKATFDVPRLGQRRTWKRHVRDRCRSVMGRRSRSRRCSTNRLIDITCLHNRPIGLVVFDVFNNIAWQLDGGKVGRSRVRGRTRKATRFGRSRGGLIGCRVARRRRCCAARRGLWRSRYGPDDARRGGGGGAITAVHRRDARGRTARTLRRYVDGGCRLGPCVAPPVLGHKTRASSTSEQQHRKGNRQVKRDPQEMGERSDSHRLKPQQLNSAENSANRTKDRGHRRSVANRRDRCKGKNITRANRPPARGKWGRGAHAMAEIWRHGQQRKGTSPKGKVLAHHWTDPRLPPELRYH